MKHIVEIDARCRFRYGNNLAKEHMKELELVLSQIPRVVEFLQSGEKEVWEDLWEAGWEWIPPHNWDDPDWDYGLCWHSLGDYVGVTAEARQEPIPAS